MDADKPQARHDVTRLLREVADGDQDAFGHLMAHIYEELKSQAAGFLRRERAGHTLQATELVHETYLRLVGQRESDWASRAHFYAVCATCMRRVLLDHARKRKTAKRGGGEGHPVPLLEVEAISTETPERFIALDEALESLGEADPRKARIAELRLFSGLELRAIAKLLDVSLSTIEKDWRLARAWLVREVTGRSSP